MDQSRSKVFIDTGGFIALVHRGDSKHKEAVNYYRANRGKIFYTSNMVVSETYTWLRYHISHPVAVKYLDIIEKASINDEIKVVSVDIAIEERARKILRKYSDQDFSYVDATSFSLLELLEIDEVFGFDSHYLVFSKTIHP